MKKLHTLLNNFKIKHLATDENTMEHDFAMLRDYLPFLFPSSTKHKFKNDETNLFQDINDYRIANIRRDDDRPNIICNEDNLPYHTRDDLWLLTLITKFINDDLKSEKYIQKKLNKVNKKIELQFPQTDTNLFNDKKVVVLKDYSKYANIKAGNILKFIQTDPEFDKMRNAYEIDLTRAQINYTMHHEKPNNVLIHHKYERNNIHTAEILYDPVASRTQKNPHELFSNGIVDGLTRMGLDKHSVEVGLVKYRNSWLNELVTNAFYNEFGIDSVLKTYIKNNWNLNCIYNNLKDLWLLRCKAQYEEKNRDIFQELNIPTTNLTKYTKKANVLDEYLPLFEEHFKELIKNEKAQVINNEQEIL